MEAHPGVPVSPMKIALAVSGGASERAIRDWLKEDLSQDSIDARLSRRGRLPALSSDQKHILIGFFIDMRLNLDAVSRSDLTDFARRYLGVELKPQRISEILTDNGITLQASRPRESRMVSQEVVDAALGLVLEVREEDYPPSCIIVMDEVGLWSNEVNAKTYSFKNWYANLSF